MAYIRNQAKVSLEAAEADHKAGRISDAQLATVRSQSTAQLDQVQTWYNQVANSISVLKSRAAASGKTISSGKLEAFEQFKELATEKDNKYYDPHYDYIFKGGARPTADESRYTGNPLPKNVMDEITRRVQQQVADMGQRTNSGSDEYAVVIPGATAAPKAAPRSPATSGEADGGLIVPHAAQRSAASTPSTPPASAAASAAAAPDISDEADEYHERFGRTGA